MIGRIQTVRHITTQSLAMHIRLWPLAHRAGIDRLYNITGAGHDNTVRKDLNRDFAADVLVVAVCNRVDEGFTERILRAEPLSFEEIVQRRFAVFAWNRDNFDSRRSNARPRLR